MRELTTDESLDLFADLLEPCAVILADTDVRDNFSKGTIAAGVAYAIKRHKPEVIRILAATDGVPVEDYKVNPFTIPIKLLRLFSMPEMKELFSSAGQKTDSASFGSLTESIGDGVN